MFRASLSIVPNGVVDMTSDWPNDLPSQGRLELKEHEIAVVRALESEETPTLPISQWYLGALRALSDEHNPDRIPQAAHSLRELLEKLPRVVFQGDRHELLEGAGRRDEARMLIENADPLANQLHSVVREGKRDRLHELRLQLVKFSHHGGQPTIDDFNGCLEELERTILDLFSPISAQDQHEIRTILDLGHPTQEDVARLFSLMEKRGANYTFFFKNAADPFWMPILKERGYFSVAPGGEQIPEGQTSPLWWPLHYLSRVKDAGDQVVDVILGIPEVSHPQIKYKILDIARTLPGA